MGNNTPSVIACLRLQQPFYFDIQYRPAHNKRVCKKSNRTFRKIQESDKNHGAGRNFKKRRKEGASLLRHNNKRSSLGLMFGLL